MLLVDRFRHQFQTTPRSIFLEKRLDGNHDEVVLRLTENAAQRLGGPDNFVGCTIHLDCLADRVPIVKKLVANIVSNECNICMPLNLGARYTASEFHLNI